MKSRVLDKSHIQQLQEEYDKRLAEEVDKAQTNAIKLCMVTFMQSLDDVGLAESTINQIVMLMERCYKKEESVVITQFNSDDTITKITVDDILRVIYRKEAEIERLNRDYSTAVETMSNSIRTANAEKEALIAGQETLQKALAESMELTDKTEANCQKAIKIIDIYERQAKTAKAEAIKEFAERLKTEAKLRNHTNYGANKQAVSYNEGVIETRKFMLVCIDNLVKEMVGDTE